MKLALLFWFLFGISSIAAHAQSPRIHIDDHAHFLYDLDLSFQIKGLEKNVLYRVDALLPHTSDPQRAFFLTLEAKSDSLGSLDFGKSFAEKKLGRSLVEPEPKYAGALTLKLMKDVALIDLPTTVSDLAAKLSNPSSLKISLLAKASKVAGTITVPWAMEIYRYDPSMQIIPLNSAEVGIDGEFYYANRAEDRPVIIIAEGSTSNPQGSWANYLAHLGYHVLSLRYFSNSAADPSVVNGSVSFRIDRTPLEIFEKAIAFVRKQPFVNAQDVSFMGDSRGGEAALLLAQYLGNDQKLKRIFANQPQFFVSGSRIGNYEKQNVGETDFEHSSWTFRGSEIPFTEFPIKDKTPFQVSLDFATERGTLEFKVINGVKVPAMRFLPSFEMINPVAESLIQLADFKGHIYSMAGEADGVWRSRESVEKISKQRTAIHDELRWVVKGAGHISFPGAMPDVLSENSGTLLGVASEQEVLAGSSAFQLSGGKQLNNAVYSILNQFQVYCGMKNYEPEQIPFGEFLLK